MSFIKDVGRPLRTAYLVVHDRIIGAFGRRSRKLVRKLQPGQDPTSTSDQAAIYVHFDVNGVVHDYVIHQLRELVDCGFRITFVTNSPIFPETSRARVAPYCRNTMWRFNVGYDFGAYKDGIAAIGDIDHLAGLVLMNDSVYGPFWKLSETLMGIDKSNVDFWGIVDSWEQRYHLQTFFVYFFANALKSRAFKQFWADLPYINNKRWVIHNAEVELSQVLTQNGLRAAALCPYWKVVQALKNDLSGLADDLTTGETSPLDRGRLNLLTGRTVNPMHFFWDALIRDFRCPFIKRELVQSNPAKISSIPQWPELISSVSQYDITIITRHLHDKGRHYLPD